MIHDFKQKLEYSLGAQQQFDMEIIKNLFGYKSIQKTDIELERKGIDYIAYTDNEVPIYIDGKTREPGASKYWHYGEPELALETWSSIPDENKWYFGNPGWTLREDYLTHYVLYTFDKSDSDKFYFIPFQLLKNALKKKRELWTKTYKLKYQPNVGYISEAIFIPASVVLKEINKQMTGNELYQQQE